MVLAKEKNKKSKGKTSKNRIKSGLQLVIFQTLWPKLFPLMKTWKIYSTKVIISENLRATREGKWVPGGGKQKGTLGRKGLML